MSLKVTKKQEAKEPKNPPVAKVRVGLVTGSIWKRETEKGTFFNVSFERRYKDGDTWKTSHSYDTGDLLNLAKAADRAHSLILDAYDAAREEQTEEPAAEAEAA